MLFVGVDLAWGEGTAARPPNETGLACIAASGEVIDAGWARGLADTLAWIERVTRAEDALVAVDAPLVVTNSSGQRLCEKQVGQRYGRWQVSANTTNLSSARQAGVAMLPGLKVLGFAYSDGWSGPPGSGRHVFECYPYTTLVGAVELGYDVERPRYKRKPKAMNAATFRPLRAAACDELVRRMGTLDVADPPLVLGSHPVPEALVREPSPVANEGDYKHREDLLDALLCAWTASFWRRHGTDRCQVLGDPPGATPVATIIAPARAEQRR